MKRRNHFFMASSLALALAVVCLGSPASNTRAEEPPTPTPTCVPGESGCDDPPNGGPGGGGHIGESIPVNVLIDRLGMTPQ